MTAAPDHPVDRDATRHDGVPWARLVLSLLLLGAPALALGLDSARDVAFLAGSFDQLEEDAPNSGADYPRNEIPNPVAQALGTETHWRDTLRDLADETLILTRVHTWVQPAFYLHGRVVDPALYLQRTPR